MKQYEAVRLIIENLGGLATLGQINTKLDTIKGCEWKTKTPFASVRRIVQTDTEIYKIKPGLYGLKSFKKDNDSKGYLTEEAQETPNTEQNHSYYQGLLLEMGRLKGHCTFCPHQDKNKKFLGSSLGEKRSLEKIPNFSYPNFVNTSSTIDVIWFNQRSMPHTFFEVEHSTDFHNSLLKFYELQDFSTKMVIVSHQKRKAEFEKKLSLSAFNTISKRVLFLNYEYLAAQYENTVKECSYDVLL